MSNPKPKRSKANRARHSQRAQFIAKQVVAVKARHLTAEQTKAAQNEAEFIDQLNCTRILMHTRKHGEDATDLIAKLMVVIGTVAQAGANIHGRTPWVNQLHGALRTLQDLCVRHSYTWRTEFKQAMDVAIQLAYQQGQQMRTLPGYVAAFTDAWHDANGAAGLVHTHQVGINLIGGVEP